MQIRTFQPGDETAQAQIFNAAAGGLSAFKPATVDEVARRYREVDTDPQTKLYAVHEGRIVGYAAFNANGRISFPWCLADCTEAREPLLDALLAAMGARGYSEAWAAYRADWRPVAEFLEGHGFRRSREMVNYLAELSSLPRSPTSPGTEISTVSRHDLPSVRALGHGVFADDDPDVLGHFFWENRYFPPSALFGLKKDGESGFAAVGLAVASGSFADPTKLDAAMPCFRLGAFGTESERHKRVNGLLSVLFRTDVDGEIVLGEGARRLEQNGLTHAAAQAPSHCVELCRFYDRFFHRQGAFPIFVRKL
jgi:hypothetical protein